jgi:hypothetical protein
VSAFVSITVQSKSSTSSVPSVAAGTIFNWESGGDVQNCENPHSKRGRNVMIFLSAGSGRQDRLHGS